MGLHTIGFSDIPYSVIMEKNCKIVEELEKRWNRRTL
jgi:hypothetical protein